MASSRHQRITPSRWDLTATRGSFIDGVLVGDNGGVKGVNPTTFNTGTLAAGNHTAELFFADRHQVQAGVTFAPTFQVTSTPEPASLSLFATGLVGVFGAVRRKRKGF